MSLAHEMCEILRLVGSYRDYGNVITLDGTQIDARVTIVALNGATVSSFDSTSQPYTESNFFQPNLNITSVGGSATFRVDFFVGSQPVTLQNFYVNTYDLDGAHASASGRQFTELHRLCQLCVVVRNEGQLPRRFALYHDGRRQPQLRCRHERFQHHPHAGLLHERVVGNGDVG